MCQEFCRPLRIASAATVNKAMGGLPSSKWVKVSESFGMEQQPSKVLHKRQAIQATKLLGNMMTDRDTHKELKRNINPAEVIKLAYGACFLVGYVLYGEKVKRVTRELSVLWR